MNELKTRIATIAIDQLKEMTELLYVNTDDGSDIVFDLVTDELMNRMETAEFVSFMDRF